MAYSTEDDKAGALASRQVYRQVQRENEKQPKRASLKKTGFPLWWCDFQGSELIPIIPPTGTIAEGSNVSDATRGKTPGQKRGEVWWGLGGKWPDKLRTELKDVKKWHADGASVGLQTRLFHAIDIDVDDEKLAAEIEALAIKHFGDAPRRTRPGSARRLLLYRIKDGEIPCRKQAIKFLLNGEKQLVELLGHGQQCVVEGPHPKGGAYEWSNRHPCERGPDGLSEITRNKAAAFYAELHDLLDMFGYPIVRSGSDDTAKPRMGLDNQALWAPGGPQQVLDALKVWRPEDMSHDEYVKAIAAIKTALGPTRDEHKGEVLEWSPGVRSTEDDQFEKRWHSVTDSSLGWEWLAAQARSSGYTGDAQHDFDDGNAPGDMGAAIPATPYDRMLKQFVFVRGLGQYNDLEDGSFLNGKDFNAANVDVKPFGSSGQQSAEAAFQNAPGARKVTTATARPGEPVFIKEVNERGIPVDAVNLWRPSTVKPNLKATTADVAPWLDLVMLLFGSGAPEREHFLDWCAFLLQRPGEKIGHAIVIGGGQGTGKDTVLRPIIEAIGVHNVAAIDTATLQGQFNFFLKCQLIYVQEAMTYGRRDLYNTVKPYISAQVTRHVVNEKNTRQYPVPNMQNWLVTTNHTNALALEDDDRRFWVHRVLIDEPPSSDYFTKLYTWLKAGGTEKVFGWLKQRDLRNFNPMAKPPMTVAKRVMLEASRPKAVRWLLEQLRDGSFAHRTVLTAEDLRSAAQNDFNAPTQEVSNEHATAALRAAGFKSAHRVRLRKGGMRTLWARGLDGTMTANAMHDLYDKECGGR